MTPTTQSNMLRINEQTMAKIAFQLDNRNVYMSTDGKVPNYPRSASPTDWKINRDKVLAFAESRDILHAFVEEELVFYLSESHQELFGADLAIVQTLSEVQLLEQHAQTIDSLMLERKQSLSELALLLTGWTSKKGLSQDELQVLHNHIGKLEFEVTRDVRHEPKKPSTLRVL